jgi:hypothetical protein
MGTPWSDIELEERNCGATGRNGESDTLLVRLKVLVSFNSVVLSFLILRAPSHQDWLMPRLNIDRMTNGREETMHAPSNLTHMNGCRKRRGVRLI